MCHDIRRQTFVMCHDFAKCKQPKVSLGATVQTIDRLDWQTDAGEDPTHDLTRSARVITTAWRHGWYSWTDGKKDMVLNLEESVLATHTLTHTHTRKVGRKYSSCSHMTWMKLCSWTGNLGVKMLPLSSKRVRTHTHTHPNITHAHIYR